MNLYTRKLARLRDKAREAAERMRAMAAAVDERDEMDPAMLELLWESGFMTMLVPKEHGGAGAGAAEAALVVEELARGSGAGALTVVLQAMGASAIADTASTKQAADLFHRMVHHRSICAFALSEPEPGPDEKPKVTTARKSKSGWLISGRKTFVSGAREADLAIVFAATNVKAGLKKALSAFVIPAGRTGMLPGLELSRAGLRGVPAVELLFQGCAVGAKDRLGKQGSGYSIANAAMVSAAPLAAALCCGLLAEAFDLALMLARSRGSKHLPLSESQPLELAIADMAAGLDSARALTWVAARAVDENMPEAERLAREAKWTASEAAVSGVDLAIDLFGVSGTLRGSALERLARDARAARLVLGQNHIHRTETARKLIAGR